MFIEYAGGAPLGMPSPGALQMAIDAMGRHYVLPQTREHPAVSSECLRLADGTEEPRDAGSLLCVPTVPFRDSRRNSGRMTQSSRTRELVEA